MYFHSVSLFLMSVAGVGQISDRVMVGPLTCVCRGGSGAGWTSGGLILRKIN